ncbi:MAG: ABC-F family ATP-binding cassette domain-containing protein [Eubacteriales bacterium]
MAIFSAENICKSYGEKTLLKDVTLYIEKNDKIGLTGINGTGKSTLLRIIFGIEDADSGRIAKAAGIRLGYLPQNPEMKPGTTVLEQVFLGAPPEWRELADHEARTILTRLGITDFDMDVSLLSGGQRKRVAIAAALSQPCDLLILDEPTNHIDGDTVAWLEGYLMKYTGALLMVTHDRYFLDRVADRIAEISSGSLYLYSGNYTKYLEINAEREEMEEASERKRQSILRKELAWIKRGPRARGTKDKSRIQRFEELSAKQGPEQGPKLALESVKSRLGKKTIEINGLSKSYGDKVLIRDFSYTFTRTDKIGIIGKNGIGKTTLLGMIAGNIQPDEGSIVWGDTVKVGYFSQECEEMDLSIRVIDTLKNIAEFVKTPDGELSATKMLERFQFTTEAQFNIVGKLSGGERRRLYLLTILMQAPNVLLLDEPTNDLDIRTLVILEDYIERFGGIVAAVSHDRYFIDKIAERVFVFEGDGVIRQYTGGYTDYFEAKPGDLKAGDKELVKEAVKRTSAEGGKIKFTYAERLEYEKIDDAIALLEEKIKEKIGEIEANASDYARLQELVAQKEQLDAELNAKMERWMYLNGKAEKMQEFNDAPPRQ